MFQRIFRIGSRLFGSLAIVMLYGCGGSSNGYQEVSGTVTFKGERIDDGSIQFFSDEKQPAIRGGAMIRDGEYRLPPDNGLKPGSYLVRISWREKLAKPGEPPPEMGPFASRERIPAKFNAESTLKAEVKAGERSTFNFDLLP